MRTVLVYSLLRSSFLGFAFLALIKPKIALAEPSVTDTPVVTLQELNFQVKAPPGWKVRQNYRGQSLVFEDPLSSKVGDTSYQRNIQIAIQNGPKPIDALEVERLTEKLSAEFSKSASDFQIIESRIIDYRGEADAILVFSTYTAAGTPMRQMHIFTSGSERNVLLTFTDLQDVFEADGALNQAWVSMMSADIGGPAPKRFDGLLYSGSGLALIVSAAFFSNQLRRRHQKKLISEEESTLFRDESAEDEEDDEFAIRDEQLSLTRSAEPQDWQIAETRYAGHIA